MTNLIKIIKEREADFNVLMGSIGYRSLKRIKVNPDEEIKSHNTQTTKAILEGVVGMIDESFWECLEHKELQFDGSCAECNECLEANVILPSLKQSLLKTIEEL